MLLLVSVILVGIVVISIVNVGDIPFQNVSTCGLGVGVYECPRGRRLYRERMMSYRPPFPYEARTRKNAKTVPHGFNLYVDDRGLSS